MPVFILSMVKKIFLGSLSIALGAVFLYSAYTKLFPIQRFEYTIVDTVHFSWLLSAITARVLIGFEAALGVLILSHFYGNKKWVLKAALALLLIFSIYLIYLWITQGNNINCGCFGDDVWMTPSTSLIKNGILIIATFLLLAFHNGWYFKRNNIISLVTVTILFILPFIFYPIPGNEPNWLGKKKHLLDLSPLYDSVKTDKPVLALQTGKRIIAFFSPTCPHCQMAAYKMHLMKVNDTSLPFFFVIGGHRDLKNFWEKTHAQEIPYTRLDQKPFINLAGTSWPAIYFVDNDTVVAETNYITLDQQQIEHWLKK